jgi:hypothetical protein
LGIDKYIWYYLHSGWSDAQKALFVIRLQSANTDGLRIAPINASYIMQYKNNLIGKHFKSLQQLLPFQIYDTATPAQFATSKYIGDLGVALWLPEIDDMQDHMVSLI